MRYKIRCTALSVALLLNFAEVLESKQTIGETGNDLEKDSKTQRVSDPHIWTQADNWNIPEVNLTLPLGKPDTIETDIPGPPLSPDDFRRGKIIVFNHIDPSKQPDPIEFAGLYEGDIDIRHMNHNDLPIKDYLPALSDPKIPGTQGRHESDQVTAEKLSRSAIADQTKKWPNGVVPYVLSSSYAEQERAVIAMAMTQFHENTCIKFAPRMTEQDYIHILKGDGCSSSVGKIGGAQQVSLGPGCVHVGIVMHEFMHAVGFWHEQSREDREKFIEIIWPNIENGMKYNFQKYGKKIIQNLGPYDTGSIMHYGPYAFARDRSKPTIIAREGGEIGQRRGFSMPDILKVKNLYRCGEPGLFITETPVTTQAPDLCEDSHKFCPDWEKTGECKNNSMWMTVFCKKSCKQCYKACDNYSLFCDYWSKMDECKKNPMYMHHFCKRSCGLCHENDNPAIGCEDHNVYCEVWSQSGQCHINPTYMLKHCKMSCKEC